MEWLTKKLPTVILGKINKKAQLLQGKMHYSRYSSCSSTASTDLQGHLRSMIIISSQRAYTTSY